MIIRARSGNFIYTENEIAVMEKSILFCKEHNIDGIVFGILSEENEINIAACQKIIKMARPMSVTFHRAIDSCENIFLAFETLIELGCDRVLTSGLHLSAFEGKEILKSLNQKYGDKIIIMPGGGVKSTNIKELINNTHCTEFHSSALSSGSFQTDENEVKKLKSQLFNPINL